LGRRLRELAITLKPHGLFVALQHASHSSHAPGPLERLNETPSLACSVVLTRTYASAFSTGLASTILLFRHIDMVNYK